jgi:hypothetical protein
VISAGLRSGWDHEHQPFDSGNILVDTFTNEHGVVRVVWLRTPWTDAGRFAGSI